MMIRLKHQELHGKLGLLVRCQIAIYKEFFTDQVIIISNQGRRDSKTRLFLIDGCPCQNSKTALKAIKKHKAQIFMIPACSPDFNPIKNVFHLVSKSLVRQAIQKNITRETFAQFSARVKKIMQEFSVETINNIIGSMNERIAMVMKAEGNRIRY